METTSLDATVIGGRATKPWKCRVIRFGGMWLEPGPDGERRFAIPDECVAVLCTERGIGWHRGPIILPSELVKFDVPPVRTPIERIPRVPIHSV